MRRYYEFQPPGVQRVVDLTFYLRVARGQNPTGQPNEISAAALRKLAERYEDGARRCRQLASVVDATPGTEVSANPYLIEVHGPRGRLDPLAEGADALLLPLEECPEKAEV